MGKCCGATPRARQKLRFPSQSGAKFTSLMALARTSLRERVRVRSHVHVWSRWARWVTIAVAVGCGEDPVGPSPVPTETPVERPPPLAPLPPPSHAESDRFATSSVCAQCHLAKEGDDAMRDASGRDVSPVRLWRASMMGLAARDPYYLAVFSQELDEHAVSAGLVERTCVRCHAPAGHLDGKNELDFAALTAGDSSVADLGRDGVTCSMCHQIADRDLGKAVSFSGGFEVGYDREIFGPHASPNQGPMQFFASYTPVQADHISSSEVCATCHTVILRPIDEDGLPTGAEIIEQAPYLEWLSSSYAQGGDGCPSCHVPTTDEDGLAIVTRIAAGTFMGANLSPRQPFGRHVLVGGNAYMLRLLGANDDWANHGLPESELEAAAQRSEAHLAQAAELTIERAEVSGGELTIEVRLTNLTGHKLPTGYPTRRAWLRVEVLDAAGEALFASGAVNDEGAIVGPNGRIDHAGAILPHRDVITSADQVQIYEAVLVDAAGAPTHLALSAEGYAKDNRLLPAGYQSGTWPIDPIGVDDESFGPGGDLVTYRVPAPAGAHRVEATLLYQSIPPWAIEAMALVPTAAAVRFHQMAVEAPPTPSVITATSRDL